MRMQPRWTKPKKFSRWYSYRTTRRRKFCSQANNRFTLHPSQNPTQGQRSVVVRYFDSEPLDSILETVAAHSQCFGGLCNVVAGLVQGSDDGLSFQFLQPFVMRKAGVNYEIIPDQRRRRRSADSGSDCVQDDLPSDQFAVRG